jgi:hypothetical protein
MKQQFAGKCAAALEDLRRALEEAADAGTIPAAVVNWPEMIAARTVLEEVQS